MHLRALSSSSEDGPNCESCEYCCLDSKKCGTQNECEKTSLIIFGTLGGLIFLILIMLFIYWMKECNKRKINILRRKKRVQYIEKQAEEDRHEGIIMANAWVTRPPLRQALISCTNLSKIYETSTSNVNKQIEEEHPFSPRKRKEVDKYLGHIEVIGMDEEGPLRIKRCLTEIEDNSSFSSEGEDINDIDNIRTTQCPLMDDPTEYVEKGYKIPLPGELNSGEDYSYGDPFGNIKSSFRTRNDSYNPKRRGSRRQTLTSEFGLDLAEARTRGNTTIDYSPRRSRRNTGVGGDQFVLSPTKCSRRNTATDALGLGFCLKLPRRPRGGTTIENSGLILSPKLRACKLINSNADSKGFILPNACPMNDIHDPTFEDINIGSCILDSIQDAPETENEVDVISLSEEQPMEEGSVISEFVSIDQEQ